MQELSPKSGGGHNFGRGRNLGRVRYIHVRTMYKQIKIYKTQNTVTPLFKSKHSHRSTHSLHKVGRVVSRHPAVIASSERSVRVPLCQHVIVQPNVPIGRRPIVDCQLFAVKKRGTDISKWYICVCGGEGGGNFTMKHIDLNS